MKIVIVGGGYAGVMAAGRLARRRDVHLTLIDATGVHVQRTRLHQVATGQRVRHVDLARALGPRGVNVVVERMVAVEPGRVVLESGDGVAYDRLLLTLGSRVRRPPGFERALTLNDPSAAKLVAERVATAGVVTVVGAGLTGLELASELAYCQKNLRVRLIDSGGLDGGFTADAAAWVRRRLGHLGVELIEHQRVGRVLESSVEVGGARLPSDVTVWAGGFEASPVMKELGQPVDSLGRLRVEPTLQVAGLPGVYAAGDSAAVSGRPWLYMSCAAAMPMGAHAADNLMREVDGRSPVDLDLGFAARCVSLGRGRGVLQHTDRLGQPTQRWHRGWLAGAAKEAILGMTMAAPALERRLKTSIYSWPSAGPALELPVAAVGH